MDQYLEKVRFLNCQNEIRIYFFLLICLLSSCTNYQDSKTDEVICNSEYDKELDKEIVTHPDQRPYYPGGNGEMLRFVFYNWKDITEGKFQPYLESELIISEKGHILGVTPRKSEKAPQVSYNMLSHNYLRGEFCI
ncbi:hypothetical protein [Xanthocytophaga flava]|uniref:hypothetical protein n=1 Tax=Xanthocytophaga flava TaxID=3048013 RepID=UPI0028D55322|nr:hypothetical protein [Xanthocytophaga flavus]MDJ1470707.1 hypothetical protein [Xanthocytophaga flavus]